MQLPTSLRDAILDTIDTYVDTVSEADTEMVVEYVIEQIELAADELDYDDLIGTMEDEGGLDGSLAEALTETFETAAEFVFTGEEVVSSLEELLTIEWVEGVAAAGDD